MSAAHERPIGLLPCGLRWWIAITACFVFALSASAQGFLIVNYQPGAVLEAPIPVDEDAFPLDWHVPTESPLEHYLLRPTFGQVVAVKDPAPRRFELQVPVPELHVPSTSPLTPVVRPRVIIGLGQPTAAGERILPGSPSPHTFMRPQFGAQMPPSGDQPLFIVETEESYLARFRETQQPQVMQTPEQGAYVGNAYVAPSAPPPATWGGYVAADMPGCKTCSQPAPSLPRTMEATGGRYDSLAWPLRRAAQSLRRMHEQSRIHSAFLALLDH